MSTALELDERLAATVSGSYTETYMNRDRVQMTMTDPELFRTASSSRVKMVLRRGDVENWKLVSCWGRLECIS